MENSFDVIIVGGGIVGAATMYKIQLAYPNKKILLLEKESGLADHQTGNNSGVIHSGIYYKPGSKKAINCVNGRRELVAFAKEHNISHDVCGKLIVAVDESELIFLNKIEQHGVDNGIEDMRRVTPEEIRQIEPYCTGIDGLFIGCTGIIDFKGATIKMAELVLCLNPLSEVHTSEEALKFEHLESATIVKTNKGEYEAANLIVCGGLQADRLARKDGIDLKEQVVGFRGDYYELKESAKHKVKNLIYPVPNPVNPFLGVHTTITLNNELKIGPTAFPVIGKEQYKAIDGFSFKDLAEFLSSSRALLRSNSVNLLGLAQEEVLKLFTKPLLKRTQKLSDSLQINKNWVKHPSGIRAQIINTKTKTIEMDYIVESDKNVVHVLNAVSPGWTSSLPFARWVVENQPLLA